ncbi:MAG: beta-propeller domain-containing protein, partial [Deltaproteobacteria bacterium]|nr:beta-propeller domain-containing protein [Nannocystaceae bacterium]
MKTSGGVWWVRALGSCALASTVGACGSSSPAQPSDFVLDNPNGDNGGDNGGLTGTGAAEDGGETGGSDPTGDGEDGGDGEREVSEADIVFVQDDRLYALSATGGLSVIDAANPDVALPVLGRHRMPGMPFEMYLDDRQVFVMMNDYGSYGWDDAAGSYTWHSASRLVALDTTNPANITTRGELEIPGSIQDSRRVGDILYLVTFEDGYCWGCSENRARTVITSLDVSNLAAVEIVDSIELVDETDEWSWSGPRSVSATDERMYIGGIDYDGWDDAHSTIDVIDISDPGGVLQRGASLTVAGQIQSRWQMDEHDGALRVISQPWQWSSDSPPVIQTFAVVSASEITELASLEMVLPRPETLQSVRFDGPRAYAITFEQTDPLFTIDLADPAAPAQVGELEIPGWVHHIEPRGDRLLALGFDRADEAGSINVSLFDVSDFAAPTMLSRVGFGGDWADFAEDQNRLHKA